MVKLLHLIRHAQAEHNVEEDWSIPDAPLTLLGRRQAEKLYSETLDIQQSADLLVSSPLKRTLQTTIIAFRGLKSRLEIQDPPKPLIVLSRLQEADAFPCDIGSSRSELENIEEFKGINFSLLEDNWNSKKGHPFGLSYILESAYGRLPVNTVINICFYHTAGEFSPDFPAVAARARWVRRWLRARPEQSIVVVTHAEILRRITGVPYYEAWSNAEFRTYTFAYENDDDAKVVPWSAEAKVQTGDNELSSGETV